MTDEKLWQKIKAGKIPCYLNAALSVSQHMKQRFPKQVSRRFLSFWKVREKPFQLLINKNRGMTLIEIMIVVGIIAFLMTMVGQEVSRRQKKAKISQAKIVIGLLEQAIAEFNYDCGYYPATLDDLISAPADCEEWGPEPYVKDGKLPKDPWKNELVYELDETGDYNITSFGADKRPGGTDYNKDISLSD